MNEFTDTQRQRAAGLLVHGEVLCLASDVVEDLLNPYGDSGDRGIPLEDVENLYRDICPECGEEVEKVEYENLDSGYECGSCGWTGDDAEAEPREVYEWYFVTGYLADNLDEKGHPLYRGYQVPLWGRCTTGQAIALDCDIQEIALSIDWIRRQVTEKGDPTK